MWPLWGKARKDAHEEEPGIAAASWTTLRAGETVLQGRYIVGERTRGEPPGEHFTVRQTKTGEELDLRLARLRDRLPEVAFAQMRHDMRRVAGGPHPYLIRTIEAGVQGDAILIVTEPRAMSLRQLIAQHRLGLDDALTHARQIAGALGFAHAHGVAHGMLTPATVELSSAGVARVADFGMRHIADYVLEPCPCDIFDRPGYLAPEEHRGFEPMVTTDIFHFGALLWELVLGAPPPARDPLVALANQTNIPSLLVEIITHCMQTRAEQRPASLAPIAQALLTLQRDLRGEQSTNVMSRIASSRVETLPLDLTQPRIPVHLPRPVTEPPTMILNAPPPALAESNPTDRPTIPQAAVTPQKRERATSKREHTEATRERAEAVVGTIAETAREARLPRKVLVAATVAVGVLALVVVSQGRGLFIPSHAAPSSQHDDIVLSRGLTALPARSQPYHVTHDLLIGPGQTLQVQSGTVVIFDAGTGIVVQGGVLEVHGKPLTPVILTSRHDDDISAVGGAQAGDWNGITITSASDGTSGRVVLDNAAVRYAGVAKSAAIACQSGTLTLTDSEQRDSAGAGVVTTDTCWGEIARTKFSHEATNAAEIATLDVRFHDNSTIGTTIKLP